MAEEIPSWLISYDISEIARKLKELKDLKEAYERAETYYDKVCKKWHLNPMISCAYTCEVWMFIFKRMFLMEAYYYQQNLKFTDYKIMSGLC